MSDYALEAQKRVIIGKKVKQLRRDGYVPGVVYGPNSDPLAIQADRRELRHVLHQAGGTQLIDLIIDDDKIPVLARNVQRDVLQGELLHIDFYRVNMNRPIRAEIPIVVYNEPPIVLSGAAVLNQTLNSVEIETLPANLPPQIELDISGLVEIGDQLTVSDLDLGDDIIIHTNSDELIVKTDYPRMIEVEEEVEEGEELFDLEPSADDVEVLTERRDDDEE